MKVKITSIVLLICLICPILLPISTRVQAATPKLQLLEITDGATSSTLSSTQQSTYDVTTIPIKKFVADRSELDGKYDVIYFASGTYSTDLVTLDPDPTNASSPNTIQTSTSTRKSNNLTKTKMNDLTLLKANEIINYYIKHNLPVLFHSSIKNQTCNSKLKPDNQCVLKNLAKNYTISSYPNVSYVSSPTEVKNLESNRPRFQISSMPKDSKTDTAPYTYGDSISFTFSIDKGNASDLTANLYIDSNFNTKYEPSELVKQDLVKNLSSGTSKYTLSYILPKGYSGVRMWKIELVGENGLKDYETGTLRFRDVKVDIHVLQVTKTSAKNGSLRTVLKKENVGINSDGVIDTTDYKMTIDVISMDEFNNSYYQKLNTGLYNMIVFGFEDSYGNVRITNTNAQKAVKDFIASGQSIFMTHDTIQRIPSSGSTFETTNSWIENFLPDTGQTYELGVKSDWNTKTEAQKLKNPGLYYMETNIGYQATYTITKANKVNDALITSFPYPLNDTINLATTHSQYFTLDLEDPEVIPLYNLSNPSDTAMDSNDSYNMYYIYKRKNITYSGAGHTNSTFNVDEQKLFVNTMLSSFVGANQAPTISVNSPDITKEIPTSQNIPLSFKVDDIDLNDTDLNYSILLNDVQIFSGKMNNGETINKDVIHKLVNDGTAKISIKAWDSKGAQATQKDLIIKIKKLNEDISFTRTISKTDTLKVGEPIKVVYKITPNEIDGTNLSLQDGQVLQVKDLKFTQTIPIDYEISSSQPNLKVVSNSADKTKTISIDLNQITYTKNSNNKYVADPINFEISLTPTTSGDGALKNSKITYTSIDGKTEKTYPFTDFIVSARDELKGIHTTESITMNKDSVDSQKILVSFDPSSALTQGIIKTMDWKVIDGNQVISVNENGEVSVLKGDSNVAFGKVKLTVTDIFGNVKEAITNVNIKYPGVKVSSINIDKQLMEVGEQRNLLTRTTILPENATNRKVEFSLINVSDLKYVLLTPEGIITANDVPPDGHLIRLQVKAKDGSDIAKEFDVQITKAITGMSFHYASLDLNVGEKFSLNQEEYLQYQPINTTQKGISSWQSNDIRFVTVDETGLVTAQSKGYATVTAISKYGDFKAAILIRVRDPKDSNTGNGNTDLKW